MSYIEEQMGHLRRYCVEGGNITKAAQAGELSTDEAARQLTQLHFQTMNMVCANAFEKFIAEELEAGFAPFDFSRFAANEMEQAPSRPCP